MSNVTKWASLMNTPHIRLKNTGIWFHWLVLVIGRSRQEPVPRAALWWWLWADVFRLVSTSDCCAVAQFLISLYLSHRLTRAVSLTATCHTSSACVSVSQTDSCGVPNGNMSYVDFQTNIVQLAKQIARTAQEMVSGWLPGAGCYPRPDSMYHWAWSC